ncbi:AraC family transcriptional regulator [Sphingomonas sp. BK069]|uniref:AraC family transcriptional regulator n=1 Tax=Sphingomonas sp. BK069 TaxID=2586979 RepID=UPI00160ED2FE|nr:AraC family transcriptional regulator [Sphingomonas sp. BK069]MBB3348363.1 AraC family transcriptional activator of mtrCDE [Sphingomonas sp. BK069]
MRKDVSELLRAMVPLLRVRPVIEDFCRFGGSWSAEHGPSGAGWAQFHIVTRGACVLERPGLGEMTLQAGDVFLLPHGDNHVVRSATRGVLRPITVDYRNGVRDKSTEGAQTDTELLCGRLEFEGGEGNPLLAVLPDEIVIRTAGEPLMDRFRRLLADIRDELDSDLPGSEVIAADFARALFVMMLRDHLGGEHAGDGTLSLLRERGTARVVLAILRDLARDWTLDEMADVAAMSRATLVRTFRRLGGQAPMTFLSDLRLAVARQRLAGTGDPIARIAADVGYGSEGALSKAVLRRYGVRPGALRLGDASG